MLLSPSAFCTAVLVLAVLYCQAINAQSYPPYAGLFEKRSLSKEGKTLPYRLMKPKGFDSSKQYPLHITLHGAPERGTDNELQVGTSSLCVAPWAVDSERVARPAFVLAPQCPPGQEWIAVHWGDCGAKLPSVASMAWPGRFVLDLIDSLRGEFPSIDTSRIYLSGGSMGAVGTWYLCQYRPNLFAAVFPVTGAGDTTMPIPFVNKIPVWTFAGSLDNTVPVNATRAMVAAIKRAGGNPRYSEIAGEGHTNSLIGGAAANHEVHVWLFSQSKDVTAIGGQRLGPCHTQIHDPGVLYSAIRGFPDNTRQHAVGTRINDLLGRTVLSGMNDRSRSDRSAVSIIIYK